MYLFFHLHLFFDINRDVYKFNPSICVHDSKNRIPPILLSPAFNLIRTVLSDDVIALFNTKS